MQIETIHRAAQTLMQLGITSDAADKALLLLSADEADAQEIEHRVHFLARLVRACGNLQNAKLAYSLAGRSGHRLDSASCELLAQALGCSDCVPAAVRLWKKALEAEVTDAELLVAAARLGEDGAEQIRVLNALKSRPETLAATADLARRLRAPGWECDGSWGAVTNPEQGLVWWDNAVPGSRRPYGMTLTSQPISLFNRLDAHFAFEVQHEILGTTDRCHLEVTSDGKRWEKVLKFEGVQEWSSVRIDLSRFGDEEVTLRFHALSGGQREGRGIEISRPRLESVSVTRQEKLRFEELSEGWEWDGPAERPNPTIVSTQSDSTVHSLPLELSGLTSPTVTLEAKVQASSVYAEAKVEVLNEAGEALISETLTPASDWQMLNLTLPTHDSAQFSLRLWSRFAKRRERDGFRVRNPRLRAGTEESREVILLDGGFEDGSSEQKALLKLVETGYLEQLQRLQRLRLGLPSLKSALALSAMLRDEAHIPALLLLFSRLKEGAVEAFGLLTDIAPDEDLLLQANVLLEAGIDNYPSTRDYLGDGLLTEPEFEEHCRMYLQLREHWSERSARRGLSLLLTPVADESVAERKEFFQSLLGANTDEEEFFAAWERHWA